MTIIDRPVELRPPGPRSDVGPVPEPGGDRRKAWSVLAALAVVACAGLVAGWAAGWRAHSLTTASMGRDAPVGAVVVSRPVQISSIHMGDVVVLHPPGRPQVTFTHRVIAVDAGPALRTEGDINGSPDPWSAHQHDLVGVVAVTVPDLGYLLQAVPLGLTGTFLVLLATSGVRRRDRLALRITCEALLGCLLLLYYRPLERATLISQTIVAGSGRAAVVNTGVLPIRVSAQGGGSAVLTPGQVGSIGVGHIDPGGAFHITTAVHLVGCWWLLVTLWALPFLAALCCRREPAAYEPANSDRHFDPATASATAAGVSA